MSTILLCLHPDGTTQVVHHTEGELQPIYEALGAQPFDIARGVNDLCAFVDDEGMLNGSYFNLPASLVLMRPVWGSAILHTADRGGYTRRIPDFTENTALAIAGAFNLLFEAAVNLGQEIRTRANSDTLPPPFITSFDSFDDITDPQGEHHDQ